MANRRSPYLSFKALSAFGILAIGAFILAKFIEDDRVQRSIDSAREASERLVRSEDAKGKAGGYPRNLNSAFHVIDGDTLQHVQSKAYVRIAGIDACEGRQLAWYDNTPWPCGAVSTAFMVSLTLGKPVECQSLGRDDYDRTLVRCGVDGIDIAAEVLRFGHAFYDDGKQLGVPWEAYRNLESDARGRRLGIWTSTLSTPREFRERETRKVQDGIRRVDGAVSN